METISTIGNALGIILMVAIVCEALVEYFKTFMKMFLDKDYKTAITQAFTIALGIGLAFIFNLRLFDDVLSQVYEGLYINPTIDMILTGILFSRGSNYFSDLVSKLTGGKKQDIKIMYGDGTDMESFLNGGDDE